MLPYFDSLGLTAPFSPPPRGRRGIIFFCELAFFFASFFIFRQRASTPPQHRLIDCRRAIFSGKVVSQVPPDYGTHDSSSCIALHQHSDRTMPRLALNGFDLHAGFIEASCVRTSEQVGCEIDSPSYYPRPSSRLTDFFDSIP